MGFTTQQGSYLVNVDTAVVKAIAEPQPQPQGSPAYPLVVAPGGTRIAYVKDCDGFNATGQCTANGGLWVSDINGTHTHEVWPMDGPFFPIEDTADTEPTPAWSPDGKRIAFVDTPDSRDGRRAALVIVNADGTHLRHYDVSPDFPTTADALAWSPDGTRLAYSMINSVAVVNVTTGRITRLVTNRSSAVKCSYEVLSFLGAEVVVGGSCPSNQIERFPIDGGRPHIINLGFLRSLAQPAALSAVASPDGRQLLVAVQRSYDGSSFYPYQMVLVDLATGRSRTVAAGDSYNAHLTGWVRG